MVGYVLLALVLVFVAVLLIRAARFTPPQSSDAAQAATVEVDVQRAMESLQAMIRIPTVSSRDPALVDEQAFEDFRQLLSVLYPLVHEHCPMQRIGESGILYRWPGQQSDAPTVLMSHYDVVPQGDPAAWKHPPFEGVIEDDVLWGRGTLDTKGTLCSVLEAAESLLAKGYTPQQDIYFSFSGDEEIAGSSAPAIVDELKAHGIQPALVVDEGGAVVEKVFPGVDIPCALVGVGEKGMADIELTAQGSGGHASTPPKHTPLGILAKGLVNIENRPFKAALPAPTVEMMQTLGRHSSFGMRILFANLWCFKGLIANVFSRAGGDMGAMCHTTVALTMAKGSPAPNVLPAKATAVANLRLAADTTVEQAVTHLDKAAGEGVSARLIHGTNASPYADTKSQAWMRVKQAIEETFDGCIVSPYIMLACSDSRHFCRICDNVLRFSAMELSKEDRGLIHAANERVAQQQVEKCVAFYLRLMLAS